MERRIHGQREYRNVYAPSGGIMSEEELRPEGLTLADRPHLHPATVAKGEKLIPRRELDLREREVSAKEREASAREREASAREKEVKLREIELRRNRWLNPSLGALTAALLAAIGYVWVARINRDSAATIQHRESLRAMAMADAEGIEHFCSTTKMNSDDRQAVCPQKLETPGQPIPSFGSWSDVNGEVITGSQIGDSVTVKYLTSRREISGHVVRPNKIFLDFKAYNSDGSKCCTGTFTSDRARIIFDNRTIWDKVK